MPKIKKFVYKEGVTKKHEVLKAAMKYLAKDKYESINTDKQEYICACISRLFPSTFPSIEIELKDEISYRLNGLSSLEHWLTKYQNISYRDISLDFYNNDQRKLQETRRQWMQSMYEEYKAKDE